MRFSARLGFRGSGKLSVKGLGPRVSLRLNQGSRTLVIITITIVVVVTTMTTVVINNQE